MTERRARVSEAEEAFVHEAERQLKETGTPDRGRFWPQDTAWPDAVGRPHVSAAWPWNPGHPEERA